MTSSIPKVTCNTQRMSVITSSLMGIIFGSAIVYIMSKMVAAQRRIALLEVHMARKADTSCVDTMRAKLLHLETHTDSFLNNISTEIKQIVDVCDAQTQTAAPIQIQTQPQTLAPPPRVAPQQVEESYMVVEGEDGVVESKECEPPCVDDMDWGFMAEEAEAHMASEVVEEADEKQEEEEEEKVEPKPAPRRRRRKT